jgi:protein-tyrosine phosphatase
MPSPRLAGSLVRGAIIVPVIDLHSHILPGLDDGPESVEGSLALARAATAAGTRAMATTSHVDLTFNLEPGDLVAARTALTAALADAGIELELLAGGEVAPARLPELDDDVLRALALGGGPTVLLECPFTPVGASMELMVADLRRRGFGVLLAHPERSPTFQHDLERLARLVALGAHAQVTAGALAGDFGGTPRDAGAKMLRRGLVHVLASDAHGDLHRAPDLRVAREELDGDQLAWMTEAAPAAILAGQPLPERPPLPRARGVRDRLRRSWSPR